MSEFADQLKRSWETLENRDPGDRWNALRLGIATNGRPILAVTDTEQNRHLLIPAQEKRYTENHQGELTVEVAHQNFNFIDDTSEFGRYLDIACKNSRLFDQFDHVVNRVLANISQASDGAEAAVIEVARWRRLFATLSSARKLSLPEKIGLFAELHVLGELTDAGSAFRPDFWTGPKREPHDFELPNRSIEVKGIAADSYSIQVNGLDQLSNTSGKRLDLVVVEVEADAHGLTVGGLLEEIASGRSDEHLLRQLAAMAGVFDSSEDTDRFSVQKLWVGEVGTDFPRMTKENIPFNQIENVHYSLILSEILPLMTVIETNQLRETLNV